jgi:carboxyl-terminal processing protease
MPRFLPYPLVMLALVTAFPAIIHAQFPKVQQQAIILKTLIERNHYNPRQVDDSLSSDIFKQFIEALDPKEEFLTLDDYQRLVAYRYKLDDELRGGSWSFLDLATKLYRESLKRADSIINSVLQKPLDFTIDENAVFTKDKTVSFSPNVTDLARRWIRWFKLVTLDEIYGARANDSSSKKSLRELLAKLESAVRQKIRSSETKNIKAILESPSGFENYVKDIYFNALATCFDPHTMFFSPEEKEDFQAQISTEEFSFGFDIDETGEGKIVIDRLTPGGPAWKSGELNKNDELLQLQWEGREPVDVSLMTAEETGGIMNQYNHGNMTIKIKKPNGTIRSVMLAKEKIETEDDIVKGYVLNGEKKIGYISLPDFYTIWEDEKGSGCANDVAKEIVKLKRENIEGLILDVRYNGGGSLGEALQLTGIFIDEGPLLGEKDRNGKLVYLKDPNRGTIYDGPMVLMVNGQSASASEVLAAALQDYNRAVVVGSTTYGKATMQLIFPMDTITSRKDVFSPDGYVKITLGKLYRVNGQTTQLNGVVPDVSLPDAYDGLEFRERFSPNVLASDSVKKNAYYKPLSFLPVGELNALSAKRIGDNKDFQAIKSMIKLQTEAMQSGKEIIPLKSEAFERWIHQKELEQTIMNETEKQPNKIFSVENHQADKQALKTDNYSKVINDVRLKLLQQDIYLEEAYQVLSDIIRIQKSKPN